MMKLEIRLAADAILLRALLEELAKRDSTLIQDVVARLTRRADRQPPADFNYDFIGDADKINAAIRDIIAELGPAPG